MTVAAKSMLCDFVAWESKPENDTGNVGDFLKRVSDWHEHVICPMTLHYVMFNLPSYAKPVVTLNKDKNNIFELHAGLLMAATKTLMNCVTEKGVGKQTMNEINKWFALMRKIDVSQAEKSTQDSFSDMIIESGVIGASTNSVKEYPLFRCGILFIHVAHIVYSICVAPHEYDTTNQYTNMNVDKESINTWEIKTAKMFDNYFKLGHGGLCADSQEGCSGTFIINLPYKWFSKEIKSNQGVPPVTGLHINLMYGIHGTIQDIMHACGNNSTSEHAMLTKLESYILDTSTLLKQRDNILKRREKVRKNYRSNMERKSDHRPREPTHYDRDVYLFGFNSYYYLCCTDRGAELRKRRSQLEAFRM